MRRPSQPHRKILVILNFNAIANISNELWIVDSKVDSHCLSFKEFSPEGADYSFHGLKLQEQTILYLQG